MFGQFYYHKTIRRVVSVFGTIFNDMYIQNTNQTSGNTIKKSRVPLAYGPKEKFLQRIKVENDLDTNQRVAIQLPRMSFEITSVAYDPETSTPMLRRVNHRNDGGVIGHTRNNSYNATPYKIGMQLNIMARHQDEALQLLEQILPYFKPDFLVSVKQLPDMDSTWDMPITLTGVSLNDDYEGGFDARRVIVYSLDFEILVRFFGPISQQGEINKVIANIYDIDGEPQYEKIEVEAVPSSPSEEGYIITTTITDFFLDEQ